MNWIVILAGFLSGALGAMGLGGGGILIIYLTLFENMNQALAQGINLIFFIPGALIALIYYTKKHMIDYKLILPAIITGLLGAASGSFLSGILDGYILSKLFAALLLLMGLKQLFFKNKKKI